MKYADRITFDPEQCGGRPCIRHYRIRVKDILDMLAGGAVKSRSSPTLHFLIPMTSTLALILRATANIKHLRLSDEVKTKWAGRE